MGEIQIRRAQSAGDGIVCREPMSRTFKADWGAASRIQRRHGACRRSLSRSVGRTRVCPLAYRSSDPISKIARQLPSLGLLNESLAVSFRRLFEHQCRSNGRGYIQILEEQH